MSQAPTNTLRRTTAPAAPQAAPQAIQPTGSRAEAITLIERRREQIAGLMAATKPEDVERFIRSATFAIARSARLLQCSPQSLIECVYTAAELKLDFTPSLGLAYMVPYKGVAQFQIGYRGLVTLAIRAGTAKTIEAHCVYENDHFEHEMGTEPRIVHRRPPLGQPRGALVGAYAIATLPNGLKQADVMDAFEIDAIRQRSKAKDDGPWVTDPGEMGKKTVVKRLCKYLQLTPDIGMALQADNEDTELEIIDEPPARPTNTSRLREAVGIGDEHAEPPPPPPPPADDRDDVPDFGDPQF